MEDAPILDITLERAMESATALRLLCNQTLPLKRSAHVNALGLSLHEQARDAKIQVTAAIVRMKVLGQTGIENDLKVILKVIEAIDKKFAEENYIDGDLTAKLTKLLSDEDSK